MVVWSQISRVAGDTISPEAIQAYHVDSACNEQRLVTASGPKSLILSSLAKYQQTAGASSRAIPVVASRASTTTPGLADVLDRPRLSHEPSLNPPRTLHSSKRRKSQSQFFAFAGAQMMTCWTWSATTWTAFTSASTAVVWHDTPTLQVRTVSSTLSTS